MSLGLPFLGAPPNGPTVAGKPFPQVFLMFIPHDDSNSEGTTQPAGTFSDSLYNDNLASVPSDFYWGDMQDESGLNELGSYYTASHDGDGFWGPAASGFEVSR